MTVKKEYLKRILDVLKGNLNQLGFTAAENRLVFERFQSEEVSACITVQTVSSKLPKSVIELDLRASLRLESVAVICERLFDRQGDIATIGGALGRFTKRDSFLSTYRFDWTKEEETQFQQLELDIAAFSRFAEEVNSYADLDRKRLARIPWLRNNFAAGLGETYKYTVPEVAAVLHCLNGERDAAIHALNIAEQNTSGRLSESHITALRSFVDDKAK